MGANVYAATFQDGTTITRKSGRPYAAAWRVVYVRTGGWNPDGATCVEHGFNGSEELARKMAGGFQASITTNLSRPKYGRPMKPNTVLSVDVVPVQVVRQIVSKPLRTFTATFQDGATVNRKARVDYRFAARLSMLANPKDTKFTTYLDWFFTAEKAQATMAARLNRIQGFYRQGPASWGVSDQWDAQGRIEVVPAVHVEA